MIERSQSLSKYVNQVIFPRRTVIVVAKGYVSGDSGFVKGRLGAVVVPCLVVEIAKVQEKRRAELLAPCQDPAQFFIAARVADSSESVVLRVGKSPLKCQWG